MRKILFLLIAIAAISLPAYTQPAQKNKLIPIDTSRRNGYCGYDASQLRYVGQRLQKANKLSNSSMTKSAYPANAIMNCGAFRIYFEDIALNTNDGFAQSPTGLVARNTVCAVYQYVQSIFDFSAIPLTDPITIEVQRSYTSANPPPNAGVLATAGPVFLSIGAPGIYNGSVLDHTLTHASPNAAFFDGVMQVNLTAPYHLSTTSPITNCSYDLFSVILHEVGHQLGFLSLLGETPPPTSSSAPPQNMPIPKFGNNQYSRFDWNFVYNGDILMPSTFKKIVGGTLTNPGINPSANIANVLRDGHLWLQNTGQFNGNLPLYSGVYGAWSSLTPGSIVSHMDGDYLSFTERYSYSPGYRQPHSMQPFMSNGETRRAYTIEEIRIFLQLGYALNPSFASSTSINGVNSNSSIILNNRAPVCTKRSTTSNASTFPDIVNADFVKINDGTPLIITLTSDPTISDADGDIISIENNSLFNIRGCGNGGNNHNQIMLNANRTVITYTPRPDFIGRAQFGFYLHDGKQRGSFMIYTIDVQPGSAFANPPNSNTPSGIQELVINGSYEEGTEVKRFGNPVDEAKTNSGMEYDREEGLFMGNIHFADAHPYQYFNWVWTSGGGIVIGSNYKECGWLVVPWKFGIRPFTFPDPAAWKNPVSPAGSRYAYLLGNYNFQALTTPLVKCERYVLRFDINFDNRNLISGSNYSFVVNAHATASSLLSPVLQSIPVNVTVGTGWQTITVPFTYCDATPAKYLNFIGTGRISFDNVSLVVDPSPLAPLNAAITPAISNIAAGGSATLSSTVTNSLCGLTYSWSPGGATTPSITVSPSVNTTYVLTVNDGCRSSMATASVLVPGCCNGGKWTSKTIDWSTKKTDIPLILKTNINEASSLKPGGGTTGPVTPIPASINITKCDSVYHLGQNGTYTFNAQYQCGTVNGQSCASAIKVKIKGISNSSLDGIYNAPVSKTFVLSGDYQITYYAYCGDKICDSCQYTLLIDKNCCLGSHWNKAEYQLVNKKPNGGWDFDPVLHSLPLVISAPIPTYSAQVAVNVENLDYACAACCQAGYIIKRINLATNVTTTEVLPPGQTSTSIYAEKDKIQVRIFSTCDGQSCGPMIIFNVACADNSCPPNHQY